MSDLLVVRAEGDPVTRGRQIGRELGQLIERSLGFYRRYFERRGVASLELQDRLAPYLAAAETRLPTYMTLIKAMAEGAMVPVWELFAVNSFEELEPQLLRREGEEPFLERDTGSREIRRHVADRCSSFACAGPGFTLLGHNEQWLAGDTGNVAVVLEMPTEGTPAVASPTVVCCIPAVGMNEFGGAQGIQSLVSPDDTIGVPRVLVSRYSLDSRDRLDAVGRAALPGRAGGYGHVFAFSTGDTFIIETTGTRSSLLEGPGPHTNHYLDPALSERGPFPSSGSTARYERMLDLLEDRRPDTPEAVMDILRDHQSTPQAICLHADPEAGEEAAAVVFSVVCDVQRGRMWVAPGNPCVTPYQEIELFGVL
jgi:isopenicillin-N N-acyltransferase-like protein